MKKQIGLFFLCLLFLQFVVAAQTTIVTQERTGLTISTNIPDAIKQSQVRNWNIHIINNTRPIEESATCLLHIYYDSYNGKERYSNVSNTFSDDGEVIFSVNNTVHEDRGYYSFKAICNTTNQAGLFEKGYFVTKNGDDPAGDVFKTIIYILFILASVGLFYTLFLTLANFVLLDEKIFDVLISWGFYLLTIIVSFLGANYLINPFIENLSNAFLDLTVYTNVVLPLIAFIITMIVKSFKKKKNLTPQEIGGFR